ncbi:MAG TPA: hypothetical protein VNV85_02445 [Puia sp.]|jgi:hypothetical protein|nr:hypothetical protein [Puia sp.]
MNNYSRLAVPFLEFKDQIIKYRDEAQKILSLPISDEDSLAMVSDQTRGWEAEVNDTLRNSFEQKENLLYREFIETPQEFRIPSFQNEQIKKPLGERVKVINNRLIAKKEFLDYNLKIIEACDAIKQDANVDLVQRKKYSMQEKLNFLLKKLYDLNDDASYPFEMLFVGNGIPLKNMLEVGQIATMLEDSGYVICNRGMGSEITGSITASGQIFVEEALQPYQENYDEITSDRAEIAEAIDSIKEQLINLSYGQEILFNELEELKDSYGKMNKKNWGQLIKGKLLDLALAKLVDNDTISFIYERLTGHDLHLLH